MKDWTAQIVFAVLVVAAGVLLLLEATGLVPILPLIWTLLLAAAAAAFWYVFFTQRPSWWAAIPGSALLGAAVARVMELDPAGLGQWTEVPFLAALGTGFWAVYLRDRRRWWAMIPGGVLLTLAVVTGVTAAVGGEVTGAIFLLGLALTFTLVAMLPPRQPRRWWAWIPAAALAVVALLVVLEAAELLAFISYLWPLAIIGAGAYLLWRATRQRRQVPERNPLQAEARGVEKVASEAPRNRPPEQDG